jgi:hypothetical protein
MADSKKRIPKTIGKYLSSDVGAPSIITSGSQLEEYITALLELDQRLDLTTSEANFAELLILLIKAYVNKPDFLIPVATSQSLPGV